jgi:uncharacterized small protein (DUF1192 family)
LTNHLRGLESESGRFTVEIREVTRRLTGSNEEVERLNREKIILERRLTEVGAQTSKLSEYENKIAMLGQEIERLNYILKSKVTEAQETQARFSKLEFEFESFRNGTKRDIDESRRIIQQLQVENRDLGGKASDVERLNNSSRDLQLNLSKVSSENKFLAEENMRAQEGLRLSTNQISKLVSDVNEVKHENENLRRRLQETGPIHQKVTEYENKVAMLSQEVERLTSLLHAKSSENNMLSTKLHDLDSMHRTISTLQEKISRLTGENYSLEEESRNAQESLRLSASQVSKTVSDLN